MYQSTFQQRKLSPIEREKYKNMTIGLCDEEERIVLGNIRTTRLEQELDRRYQYALRKLEMVNMTINNFAEIQEPTLVDIQQYFKDLKAVLG